MPKGGRRYISWELKRCLGVFIVAAAAAVPSTVWADDGTDAPWADELSELRDEVKGLRQRLEADATGGSNSLESSNSTLHVAGYADFGFTDEQSSDSTFTVGHFAPIFHYKHKDIVMLESELEFALDSEGETEVNVEYLTLDLFLNDYMTLVGGKFLSPIGQFIQNLHPSWINKLPSAPLGFGHGEAAPFEHVGMQLRGGFPAGSTRFNYSVFVSNGPNIHGEVPVIQGGHSELPAGEGEDNHGGAPDASAGGEHNEEEAAGEHADGAEQSEEEHVEESSPGEHAEDDEHAEDEHAEPAVMRANYRSGDAYFRSAGHGTSDAAFELDESTFDGNSNKVVGGRIGFMPIDNLEIAASGAVGDVSSDDGDRDYSVLGADFWLRVKEFDFRAEYVETSIGAAPGVPSEDVELEAWFVQASHQLFFMPKVEPVVRFGAYEAPGFERERLTLGLNYLFASNVIAKVAYDFDDYDREQDRDRVMLQLAYGF